MTRLQEIFVLRHLGSPGLISVEIGAIQGGPYGFRSADRAPPRGGEPRSFPENEVAVETARRLGYEGNTPPETSFNVGEMLIHFPFSNAKDARNVAGRVLSFLEQTQDSLTYGQGSSSGNGFAAVTRARISGAPPPEAREHTTPEHSSFRLDKRSPFQGG